MMDMKAIQYYWDSLLVGLYGKHTKAGFMPIRLVSHFRPDLMNGSSVSDDGWDWFNSLELRRCRDITSKNKLKFCMVKSRVDDFIGSHSMPLLLALMDKKTSDSDILENIRFFKWTRRNHYKNAKIRSKVKTVNLKKHREEHGDGMLFRLRTRENDKRRDWNTVK